MGMVRKQLYIEPEQQRKLRSLAALWDCKEAEVLRAAIDRLPDPDASVTERLRAAGVLVDPPEEDDDLPPPSDDDEDDEDEVTAGIGRIYLGAAVIEDRR